MKEPKGPVRYHVIRGSFWLSVPDVMSASYRHGSQPWHASFMGFRPVCNARREGC